MSKAVQLREQLVKASIEWENYFGVAPSITSVISELDAALIVGMNEDSYCASGENRKIEQPSQKILISSSTTFVIKLPPIGLVAKRGQKSHG